MLPGICPEERAKVAALDILVFMRFNNCYSKVLEEQLFEFLFNLSKVDKDVK